MPNKRKKILITTLALGLASVVVDRAIGYGPTTPQSAGAAESGPVSLQQQDPALNDIAVACDAAMLVDHSLATRMEKLRLEHDLVPDKARDAFCPSQDWLAQLSPKDNRSGKPSSTSSDEVRAREFAANHQLKAVVLVTGGGAAIIDDEYVRIGQELNAFKLLSVTKHSAVLVSNGMRVTLQLDVDEQD